MIRDEYSDEVGDLWDAFSAGLKRQGRDWIRVGRDRDHEMLRNMMCAAQNAFSEAAIQQMSMKTFRDSYPGFVVHGIMKEPPQQPLFGGMFGSLI